MRCTPVFALVASLGTTLAIAQPGSPTLRVTDPAGIRALQSLNARIEALSRQVMVCVEKKLAPPESCMCRFPAELAAVRKEHQSAIGAYPAWANRAVAWTDSSSGTPVGHTIAIANLASQFGKCAAR
jgi:hypothetical protein